MYLYLVQRTGGVGWKETDSVVVAAASPKQARMIAREARGNQSPLVWEADDVEVQHIGTATRNSKPSIVHTSFKAG